MIYSQNKHDTIYIPKNLRLFMKKRTFSIIYVAKLYRFIDYRGTIDIC